MYSFWLDESNIYAAKYQTPTISILLMNVLISSEFLMHIFLLCM